MQAAILRCGIAEFLFQCVDFADAPNVAHFMRKLRAEECVNAFFGGFHSDNSGTQDQDVHVVVFDALVSRIGIVTQARADAANLVRSHTRAYAAAADENAAFRLSRNDSAADFFREIGVVDGRRGICSHIENLVALLFQILDHRLFQFVPCVVTANDDEHE